MSTLSPPSTAAKRSTKGSGRGGNKHHSNASAFVSRALIPLFVALAIFCAAAAVVTIIVRRRSRRRRRSHHDNMSSEEQVGPGATIKDVPKLWDLWTKITIAGEGEVLADHHQDETAEGWKSTMPISVVSPPSQNNSLYFSDDISHRHLHTSSDLDQPDHFLSERLTYQAHRYQNRHKESDEQSECEDQILMGRYSETLERQEIFQVMVAIAMPKSNKSTGDLKYSIGIASVYITSGKKRGYTIATSDCSNT